MLVDSHCHLNYPQFEGKLPEIMSNANNSGIQFFLSISTKIEEFETIQAIALNNTPIAFTVGVHPHHAGEYNLSKIKEELNRFINTPKMVGLGETGLDYYYNNSPRDAQIASFELHLQLAVEHDLPVVIHTRDADEDTLAVLRNFPKTRAVFHCFSGSQALANAALEMGHYLSFSGIITFKKAGDLREVVKQTPLDRFLVETDSPYLAPEPLRGKSNEPAYVSYVAQKVADVKGISLEDVATHSTQNFLKLFNNIEIP